MIMSAPGLLRASSREGEEDEQEKEALIWGVWAVGARVLDFQRQLTPPRPVWEWGFWGLRDRASY